MNAAYYPYEIDRLPYECESTPGGNAPLKNCFYSKIMKPWFPQPKENDIVIPFKRGSRCRSGATSSATTTIPAIRPTGSFSSRSTSLTRRRLPFRQSAKDRKQMPTPHEAESKSDYISRCVKEVMGEGKTQEQAVGQCDGMWREHAGASTYKDFASAFVAERARRRGQ